LVHSPFRAAGKDKAVRERLLSNDPNGWAAAWYDHGDVHTLPRLSEIAVPAICTAGEHDKSSPPPVVQRIADAIPAARFAVLPRAPHMLFIEQPEEMARTFAPSLRDIARTHNR
jgi:3-oxoadipate enol-lactonase